MELRDSLFALKFRSSWSNIPDEIRAASHNRADLEGKTKDSTYDGVYAETEGDVVILELEIPPSLRTLREKGAVFGVNKNDTAVGCWFADDAGDLRPHRLAYNDRDEPEWTWNQEERDYLWASAYADGEAQSPLSEYETWIESLEAEYDKNKPGS